MTADFSYIPEMPEEELDRIIAEADLERKATAADADQEVEVQDESWTIADDKTADWAVRRIAEERAELARIKELAEAEIAQIEEKLQIAEKRCENGTRFLTAKLAEYFHTVPHRSTKTKESYRLLSGTLTMKKGGLQMEKNDEALIGYLKQSGNEELIQITEKPRWGEYKKRLQIVDGAVVDTETGDMVQGVSVVEKPDTFTVDI